jgi:hypothetical protein
VLHYLKLDVLQLADVFESFRDLSLAVYGLDAACFVSSPSLTWSAMLKSTGITLDLITDPEMHRLITSGVRGGVCSVSKRHAVANTPGQADYNADLPPSWIGYFDKNNLYGEAMMQELPMCDFNWVVDEALAQLEQSLIAGSEIQPNGQNVGYILEVDLDYPTHLHEAHREYPLAPETLNVSAEEEPSQYLIGLRETYQTRPTNVSKLVPNLHNKKNYVVYWKNLNYYISKGLRVTKVCMSDFILIKSIVLDTTLQYHNILNLI